MSSNENITREEVKKEFELERMILFSDAVFAIVITLMAIDIKLPESEKLTEGELIHGINLLMPVFLTYTVSFIFIGVTWFNHLKVFSLLKDYDTGLIVRNLLLLFFVGLFPFGASIAAKGTEETVLPFFIYMFINILYPNEYCHLCYFCLPETDIHRSRYNRCPKLARNNRCHHILMRL